TDPRLLARSPWCKRDIDAESIYHYLNFACIPAPRTIFTEIRRLEPSTRFRREDGRTAEDRWFVPEYPEDLRGSDAKLAADLRRHIVDAVGSHGLGGLHPGLGGLSL